MCQRLAGNFLAGLHWKRQNVSGMSGNGAISGRLLADYFRIADQPGVGPAITKSAFLDTRESSKLSVL
jgi:hypothetical protein